MLKEDIGFVSSFEDSLLFFDEVEEEKTHAIESDPWWEEYASDEGMNKEQLLNDAYFSDCVKKSVIERHTKNMLFPCI